MEKAKILINKPVYLGLSMLQLSKTVIYEFWYDYVKPNYSEQAKPCCMDTNSFILYIKTDDIYKDIAEIADTKFGTSNYELKRPLHKKGTIKLLV